MSARELRWGQVVSMGLLAAACSKPGQKDGAGTETSAGAQKVEATGDKDCCMGKNDCKGKGGCAVPESHSCMGKNDCKGKGGCNMHCKK